MIVPIVRNPVNKFTVARVHYSLDSEKNNEAWIKSAMQGMPERGWLREYEIDYSTYSGKAFYSEFKEFNIAKESFTYIQGNIIYRGWDFGFHRPCMLITWLNEFDQWCWKKCILGQDEGIMQFGQRCVRFCQSEYPGARYIDYCDPAGHQMNDKSEQTSVQILNSLGVYPQSQKQEIKQGAEIIRQKLLLRVDGKPGLLIDPEETYLIDGMKGGLHYPETKEGQTEAEHYEKEGYYEHFGDTARYVAVGIFTVIGQQQMQNEIARDPMEQEYAMGRPMYSDNDSSNNYFGESEEYI